MSNHLSTREDVEDLQNEFVRACDKGDGVVRRHSDKISCSTQHGTMNFVQDRDTGDVFVTADSAARSNDKDYINQLDAQLKNPHEIRFREGVNKIEARKDEHDINLAANKYPSYGEP